MATTTSDRTELTPEEAAARLGCSRRTVERLVATGRLVARRTFNGRRLVEQTSVESLLASSKNEQRTT